MARLTLQVAGESHGPGLVAILDGLPAGVAWPEARLARWLALRREAAGRGPRAPAEPDRLEVLAGVRDGRTNGGPVALRVGNRDRSGRSQDRAGQAVGLEFPRPGHGDLAGARKWGLTDATVVAELTSARVTAAYTAAGAVCAELLAAADMALLAHVVRVGPVRLRQRNWRGRPALAGLVARAEATPWLVLDESRREAVEAAVERARGAGETLGGIFEVVASPVPAGLGRPQPLDARLDSRLAGTLMGIPAVKAVAMGRGLVAGGARGSAWNDPFAGGPKPFARRTNRAGGVEGGMTNGEPLVVQGVMKPVPTLGTPQPSASLVDGRAGPAPAIRGDVCAVFAGAVVARSLVAVVLADELLRRFGGETLDDFVRHSRG